jgi:arylsulfatase A-like enzyme
LIIKFPYSKKVKEDRNYDLLSFIDFAPTILSIAGIEIPEIFQGNAFLGSKKSKNKRKYSFSASDRFDEITERKRAVKTKKYKYVRNYDTNQPHAIDNYYRTQMNLMRHLNNLNKLDLLSEEQKLWFKSPKSKEEFYDLENDPFELNNVITDKAFSSKIEELRAQLDNWMIQINDKVDLSEKELIEIITK